MKILNKVTLTITILTTSYQANCMQAKELRAQERPRIDYVASSYERTPLSDFLADIELKPAEKTAPAYREIDCTILTPQKALLKTRMVKAGDRLLKSPNKDNAREVLRVLEEMRVLTLTEVIELSKKKKFVPLTELEENYIKSFKINNDNNKQAIEDLKRQFNIKD